MIEFIIGVWCRKMHDWEPTGRRSIGSREYECLDCGRTWAVSFMGEHYGAALPSLEFESAIGWDKPASRESGEKA